MINKFLRVSNLGWLLTFLFISIQIYGNQSIKSIYLENNRRIS